MPSVATAKARDRAFAVTAAAVLATYNNVAGRHEWHDRWYVPLNACATGAALAAAAASGLTVADVGLSPGWWRLGRAGMWWAGAAAAGWVVVSTVPATRPVLDDKRSARLDGRAVAYQAAVRIPFGTVVWEEVAFRGVLQAALRRVLPAPAAIAVTSGVFGLWHIRPTWQALRANGLADRRANVAAGVGAGVAATAAGGVLLSWLRERSGGLAAPMALHLVTNSGAAVAAWAVRRAASRRRNPAQRPGASGRQGS
ncbi:MAG TPA: CPBP family intramembrane glutamic endopeptidase [Streptosporangiaceae bacterium]|nr:CPBP family intramembrane glutamic endopeptidase [Streptosporangiaceae bacterium]